MSENVYILGTGMIKFGKLGDKGIKDMTGEALDLVLKDCDLTREDLEAAWFSNSGWGGAEGQNSIRVVIAKDGSIEVFEMISGSGSKLLDRETQRMIERVKQFPPFPEHMIEERITLTIPVIYNIR